MIEVIKNYYKAWESKDKDLLESVLHPNLYGVRLYTEGLYFSKNDILNDFDKVVYEKLIIRNYEEKKDNVLLTMTINDQDIITKITIKDEKIFKVYETLNTGKTRIKCICSYDGSEYHGYQKQPNTVTIQGTIVDAIKKAFKLDEIQIHSSGRTDKGVHALNQVFHFDLDTKIKEENIQKILNSYLPDSIHIKQVEFTNPTFHSRYDVVEKEYMYKINKKELNPIQRNYEWYIKDFNKEQFQEQLNQIIGTHDFTSFTKNNPNQTTIRTIFDAFIKEDDTYVYVHLKGNGFLRYMVRNIIGAVLSINKGKLKYSIKELLELKDVNLNKDIAPSNGLYLYNVKY